MPCELCLAPYIFGFSALAQLIVDSAGHLKSQKSRYHGRLFDRFTSLRWCRRHTEHSMHPTWVLSFRPLVEATGAESGAVILTSRHVQVPEKQLRWNQSPHGSHLPFVEGVIFPGILN